MQESLVPVGPPPKKQKSPRRNRPAPSAVVAETVPSTSQQETPNSEEIKKRIPMLIRGIGVHQVIPKEATRDVLTGKVAFYLVDDRNGVTLFPAKHNLAAFKLDQEHFEKFEDFTCLGGHLRELKEIPRKREGLGYRRRYVSTELLNRGIYPVEFNIRMKALMLMMKDD